jgi:tetratricopeptide (TPR) repeat protein
MKYILIIGFSSHKHLEKGFASWSGKYLEDIASYSDLNLLNISNTQTAVAYLTGFENLDSECRLLKLSNLSFNGKKFTIKYEAAETLEYDSSFIKQTLKYYLAKAELKLIPFCVSVEEEELNKIIDDAAASYKIKKMTAKNDWIGIYNMFTPINELKDKPHIWNNHYLLSELSFAAAKLSETYINLKQHFQDDTEKKNFLSRQRKYRNEAIMLRKRCIELDPKNPGYYSNLAYSHYQFTLELTTPGGRRDGNVMQEAEKAIEYIDKALKIDPHRIPDLYRKGNILSSILPPLTLFGKTHVTSSEGTDTPKEQINKAKELIAQGIECFKKAEKVYEIMPLLEDKMTKRYHKEYVKSLYDMARAFNELVTSDWDITVYLFPLTDYSNITRNISINRTDIKYIDNAIETLQRCIIEDRKLNISGIKEIDYIFTAKFNGWCEGVNKLYSLGKFYFQKYWLLTKAGEYESIEANYYRDEAEKYLLEALRFPWIPEKQKQGKGFIAERLARLYITRKEYDKAIDVLTNFIKGKTDYYIRYTYSSAAILAGKYNTAKEQVELALRYEKSNLEIWLGYYLLAFSEYKKGNLEKAFELLKKVKDLCEKTAKKNLDSVLIAEAFIYYKQNNIENALKCLETAMNLNPYRTSIKLRYQKWKNKTY